MRTVSLGGLSVSAEGLGCFGMSSVYGPADWDTSIDTIRRALDLGVTFIDTADRYGSGHNEVLVGRAIVGRRDEVQLATKAGMDASTKRGTVVLRGEADYIKRACDASLQRLGVDDVDLFYLHRPPQTGSLEEAVGAMSELVTEGKVRYLGLSEVTGDQLHAAYAIHPIAAVQSEYSLWTRDPETTVADAARDLKVGLVAYSPLGRGFLTGTVDVRRLGVGDGRSVMPRFTGEGADANSRLVDAVRSLATSKSATAAQIALAWVLAQSPRWGVPVVPIPGTKRTRWLEENVGAIDVELSPDDLTRLDDLAGMVVGARY